MATMQLIYFTREQDGSVRRAKSLEDAEQRVDRGLATEWWPEYAWIRPRDEEG